MLRKSTGLKLTMQLEDINTLDVDTIIVDGFNRKEILEAIEKLLTKDGVKMYNKLHKWKIIK